MKDRFTLAILLVILWISLFIFQKYLPDWFSIFIIVGFMAIYASLLQMAQYHQKRKAIKYCKSKIKKVNSSFDGKSNKYRIPSNLNFSNKKFPYFQENYEPFVSILIPAHNEESVIENTVLNMMSLDYPKYEIIIIDDRSIDNTAEILKKLNKEYPDKVRYYIRGQSAFPGKSAVLNEAFLMTKGDVICVFDADARVNPNFLTSILPYLADSDTGAVQARKVIINNDYNILTRCQNNEYALDTHFQVGRDSIRGAVELRGNGQLIKREALIDIGGWNNFTITDDLDLSTRLHLKNWDIRFCPYVEVYEEGVLRFWPLLRQRRRWVEGSIRRYLDYFTEVLTSKDISLRVSLDMWAYISEFVLPIWLISEYFIQGIKFIRGVEHNIISSLAIIPIVCIFFISALIYGIKQYNKMPLRKAIIQGIETGLYMLVIWTPVVTFIVFKIILMKRTMDWGKTAHGVESEVAELAENTVQ